MVCLAGLINALKVVGKKIENVSIVISGAYAAGTSIAKILLNAKVQRTLWYAIPPELFIKAERPI